MKTSDTTKQKKDDEHRIKKWMKEHPVEVTLIILGFGLILFYGIFIIIGVTTPH